MFENARVAALNSALRLYSSMSNQYEFEQKVKTNCAISFISLSTYMKPPKECNESTHSFNVA